MAKLTKPQMKAHNEALRILRKDRLTDDERDYVFTNFHPGTEHMNGAAGAFFTPPSLANDATIGVSGRVLDLCAGIGTLAAHVHWGSQYDHSKRTSLDVTCVEINPRYVEIGRKLCPWANWINADIFKLNPSKLGRFDWVISNPPFGTVSRTGNAPRYSGRHFDLHVLDIAAEYSDYAAFILPAMSAPFKYSGNRFYERLENSRGAEYERHTGAMLQPHVGIDCTVYKDDWKDVSPAIEVVEADFSSIQRNALARLEGSQQLDLLAAE